MEERVGKMFAIIAWTLVPGIVFPQVATAVQQDIIQLQRQKAIEAQLQPPTSDVRLSAATGTSRLGFPDETPCFDILHIILNGLNDVQDGLPLQRLAGKISHTGLTDASDRYVTFATARSKPAGYQTRSLTRGLNLNWCV